MAMYIANDFFSSTGVYIAMVVLSKGSVNRHSRSSNVAFTSAITHVALVLTQAT